MSFFTPPVLLFLLLTSLDTLCAANIGQKIVNGEYATEGQFKYQAAIVLSRFEICSGALISNQVVLTTATCVHNIRPLEVHVGALNYKETTEPGHLVVETTDYLIHENYMAFYARHNLALIFLPEPVSGPNIEPIRLPARSMVGLESEGELVSISGWGSAQSGFPSESILKFAQGNVLNQEVCRFSYGDLFVDADKICLENAAPCLGDAGGPMAMLEGDNLPTLLGTLSYFNEDDCESGDSAVYMRTSQYLDWIEQNAGVTIRP